MIIRQGGGNSGIGDYLVNGEKRGRPYSRDELDTRIILDGDLDVTESIINSIPDSGQERYLHMTLSFNEPDITPEKMQAVYDDYKKLLLKAYGADELNTYAEIHWPKTKQLFDRTTGKLYDRHPHIHMVIPKTNMLSGKYTSPSGMYARNINIWEAIQEDVNNRHGLKSPAHSPRISLENYRAVLERHKTTQFKSSTGELKKGIFDAIEGKGIRTWSEFQSAVSAFGELKVRNKGTQWEYLAVKAPGSERFTNLNNPMFSKEYIETRALPREPLTQYQIDNRLRQWERVSLELKYIEDAGPAVKKQYRALDETGKDLFLLKREAEFYERYEISESERKPRTFRQSYSKFERGTAANKRSLYELPPRHMVHDRDGGASFRTELLLPDNEFNVLQLAEADRSSRLHGALYSSSRIIESKDQIRSAADQIIFNLEEDQAIEKAQELEHFKAIRLNLNPELVLAYAQAHYLIDPASHKTFSAKDGSARIKFGVNNYNVSDFFTKGLGLEWEQTKPILLSLYDAQLNNKVTFPVPNDTIRSALSRFSDDDYSIKVDHHRLELELLKKKEREALRELQKQYRYNVRSIYTESISYTERGKRRALEAFYKLVLEEELKADLQHERERINQIKYPFSEHFKNYLTQQQVIDMSIIDELKEKYLSKPVDQEENGFGTSRAFEVLDGREAARRAKLMAQLENQGKPYTQYGYSFKDLLPEQKKESVVFYHDSQKLFEARADKVLVTGALDPDKTATALAYSLQRFGNPLDITGTNDFKDQVVDVAARSGLDVKFTDPVLNDALARRIQELALENGDQQNAISAESLDLDMTLEEPAAVDQALRESKEREIESDLAALADEVKELAAVSIMQRNNVHSFEPVTAETAELDAALFQGLANTPAMQARFAVDMEKLAQGNAEYSQALADAGVRSEVALAGHAAVKFMDQLERAYSSGRPEIIPEDWNQEPAQASSVYPEPTAADEAFAAELVAGIEAEADPFADQAEIIPENWNQEPAQASSVYPEPTAADEAFAAELVAGIEAEADPFADQAEIIPEDWNQEPAQASPVYPEPTAADEAFAAELVQGMSDVERMEAADAEHDEEQAEIIPENWNQEPARYAAELAQGMTASEQAVFSNKVLLAELMARREAIKQEIKTESQDMSLADRLARVTGFKKTALDLDLADMDSSIKEVRQNLAGRKVETVLDRNGEAIIGAAEIDELVKIELRAEAFAEVVREQGIEQAQEQVTPEVANQWVQADAESLQEIRSPELLESASRTIEANAAAVPIYGQEMANQAEIIPEDWNQEPAQASPVYPEPTAADEAFAAELVQGVSDVERMEAADAEHEANQAEIIPEDWNKVSASPYEPQTAEAQQAVDDFAAEVDRGLAEWNQELAPASYAQRVDETAQDIFRRVEAGESITSEQRQAAVNLAEEAIATKRVEISGSDPVAREANNMPEPQQMAARSIAAALARADVDANNPFKDESLSKSYDAERRHMNFLAERAENEAKSASPYEPQTAEAQQAVDDFAAEVDRGLAEWNQEPAQASPVENLILVDGATGHVWDGQEFTDSFDIDKAQRYTPEEGLSKAFELELIHHVEPDDAPIEIHRYDEVRDKSYKVTNTEHVSTWPVANKRFSSEFGTQLDRNQYLEMRDGAKDRVAVITSNNEINQMLGLKVDTKLTIENISAKSAVNEIEQIDSLGSNAERKQAAQIIVEKLNEIRSSESASGRAEIRNAAMAVAALCSTNSELANEITNAASDESKPYIAAIIERGQELNTAQASQPKQPASPDMEM